MLRAAAAACAGRHDAASHRAASLSYSRRRIHGRTSPNVTDDNFQAEVLETESPCSSTSGRPGAARAASSPRSSRRSPPSATSCAIVKLNVDENQRTAAQYGVLSIPTMILFKNGAGRQEDHRRVPEEASSRPSSSRRSPRASARSDRHRLRPVARVLRGAAVRRRTDALGLELPRTAPHRRARSARRAVALQHPVRVGQLVADELLVEPPRGSGRRADRLDDVGVARPATRQGSPRARSGACRCPCALRGRLAQEPRPPPPGPYPGVSARELPDATGRGPAVASPP